MHKVPRMGLGRGTKWWDREGTEMGHAGTEGGGDRTCMVDGYGDGWVRQ